MRVYHACDVNCRLNGRRRRKKNYAPASWLSCVALFCCCCCSSCCPHLNVSKSLRTRTEKNWIRSRARAHKCKMIRMACQWGGRLRRNARIHSDGAAGALSLSRSMLSQMIRAAPLGYCCAWHRANGKPIRRRNKKSPEIACGQVPHGPKCDDRMLVRPSFGAWHFSDEDDKGERNGAYSDGVKRGIYATIAKTKVSNLCGCVCVCVCD